MPVEKVMCTITGTSKLLFHVYCCGEQLAEKVEWWAEFKKEVKTDALAYDALRATDLARTLKERHDGQKSDESLERGSYTADMRRNRTNQSVRLRA